jgi:predicted membrane protein
MLPRQKIAMIIICAFIFMCILDLVRRRMLREEYSWIWLLTSLSLFVLVIKYNWLVAITRTIGAVLPTSTLFLGALIFLMILSVQFSVRISRLTDQVKNLVQENALLREKIEEIGVATDIFQTQIHRRT